MGTVAELSQDLQGILSDTAVNLNKLLNSDMLLIYLGRHASNRLKYRKCDALSRKQRGQIYFKTPQINNDNSLFSVSTNFNGREGLIPLSEKKNINLHEIEILTNKLSIKKDILLKFINSGQYYVLIAKTFLPIPEKQREKRRFYKVSNDNKPCFLYHPSDQWQ